MSRVYNFSAGPSMLPLQVLEECAKDMLDYKGSGMSVMEMSHRSPVYDEIIKDAEAKLRQLMNIPDNYKVLFLQGGASTQFAAVPLNLMNKNKKADYIVTRNVRDFKNSDVPAITPSELLARIGALLRRMSLQNKTANSTIKKLVSEPFELDGQSRMLYKNGEIIELTQIEYQIMKFLKYVQIKNH